MELLMHFLKYVGRKKHGMI